MTLKEQAKDLVEIMKTSNNPEAFYWALVKLTQIRHCDPDATKDLGVDLIDSLGSKILESVTEALKFRARPVDSPIGTRKISA